MSYDTAHHKQDTEDTGVKQLTQQTLTGVTASRGILILFLYYLYIIYIYFIYGRTIQRCSLSSTPEHPLKATPCRAYWLNICKLSLSTWKAKVNVWYKSSRISVSIMVVETYEPTCVCCVYQYRSKSLDFGLWLRQQTIPDQPRKLYVRLWWMFSIKLLMF